MAKPRTKGSILPESILDAATRLFIERGLDGTSMYDIATELGVTRTAVYYYFKNKEAMLAALTDNVTRVAGKMAAELTQYQDLGPVEALRNLVTQHARLILTHALQFRVVERNEHNLSPKRRDNARASRRAVLTSFAEIIQRGVDSGDFRVVDPKVAAFAIIGMCNWTAWWYDPSGARSQDEIIAMLADLAVSSVRQDGAKRPRAAGVSESLRLLRKELAYLERRIEDEPT